jgi:predicted deacylase
MVAPLFAGSNPPVMDGEEPLIECDGPAGRRLTTMTVVGRLLLTWLCLFLMSYVAEAQSRPGSFGVGAVVASRGEIASGRLEVAAGSDGGTFIPISVAHGARPGPVLALIAGVHGSETTPILALQQLLPKLDARQLSGTVVLVHAANVPSFLGRTIYVGPVDGKNLNRQFPGRADGTISERIAYTLTTEVMRRADYVVDIHSGDANEDLTPWTGFYAKHGTPDVIRRSREMAVAFGLDFIVEFPFAPAKPEEAIYTGAAAVQLGKPSFDVEVGRLGLIEPRNISTVVEGLLSVMRHLRMLDGEPLRPASPWFIQRRVNLAADDDGIFYPLVHAGAYVTKGMRLGYVTDFHGRRTQDIVATEIGAVLSIVATPPVKRGETIVVIAVAASAAPEPSTP